MFETAGSLATLVPVFGLIGLVGLPLLATFIAVFAGAFARSTERRLGPTIACALCAFGTFALASLFAAQLLLLPRGHLLVQHVSQLGRLGMLDLAFDLALDPRSATFAVVVAIIALASTLHTAWATRPGRTA